MGNKNTVDSNQGERMNSNMLEFSNNGQVETNDMQETETDDESAINNKLTDDILKEMDGSNADGSDIDDSDIDDSDIDDSQERTAGPRIHYSSSSDSKDEEELKSSEGEIPHTYNFRDRRTIKPAVEDKTKESLPQEKTQTPLPQEKTQEENKCHDYNTRASKKRSGLQLVSPDDFVANDDDAKPKATSKIKRVVKKTVNHLIPTMKKPRKTKMSGRSNSPKKSSKQREDEPNIEAPKTIVQVKSDKRSRKFEVSARRVKELQIITCWENKIDQSEKPKHQHFMFSYDEMVTEPHNAQYDRYKREGGGQFFFMVPDDFDPKFLGEHLEKIGRAMKKGKRSGTNWKIVASILDYHRCLYGNKKFRSQGQNNQASKNNSLFGEGYN